MPACCFVDAVPLRMIAGFKRVKALTKDLAVVAEALNGSTLLSLDETNSRIKRRTPLPAFDVNDIARRTVVVEHLPDKSTIGRVAVACTSRCVQTAASPYSA